MIEGSCPACRRAFKVDDRYAGMTGRCKTCGAEIRVPGEPDLGLAGLPPLEVSTSPQPPPQTSPAPQPAVAATGHSAQPSNPAATAAPPQQPGNIAAPTPTQHPFPVAAPTPPQQPGPARDVPADETTRYHDSRSRYEVSRGPTALPGPWLQEDRERLAARAAARAQAPVEAGPQPPQAQPTPPAAPEALAERFITPPEPEPPRSAGRPANVPIASIAVTLLGLGFAAHFATAGTWGIAAAAIGLLLAVLAAVRLWRGHWDGFLAGLLFCLCAAGGALVPSAVPIARDIFLAASAVAILLLVLIPLRRSGRDYFTT